MFGRVERVVDELQGVALPAVLDREVLFKDGLQADVLALFRRNVVLHEIAEGLNLYLQEVGILVHVGDARERDTTAPVRRLTVGVKHRQTGLRD